MADDKKEQSNRGWFTRPEMLAKMQAQNTAQNAALNTLGGMSQGLMNAALGAYDSANPAAYDYNARAQVTIAEDWMRRVDSLERGLRTLAQSNGALQADVEHLRGFYGWLIHSYPETVAQYKALKELEEACKSDEQRAEAQQPWSAHVQP